MIALPLKRKKHTYKLKVLCDNWDLSCKSAASQILLSSLEVTIITTVLSVILPLVFRGILFVCLFVCCLVWFGLVWFGFFFFWYQELNSGHCACQAGAVPLSYTPDPLQMFFCGVCIWCICGLLHTGTFLYKNDIILYKLFSNLLLFANILITSFSCIFAAS